MAKKLPKRPRGDDGDVVSDLITTVSGESDASYPAADVIPPEVYGSSGLPPVAKPALSSSAGAPHAQPAPAPQTRNSFVPVVLGGLVAGAIGFAVASLTTPTAEIDLENLVATQDARMAALQQQITAREPVDLAPLLTAQADLSAKLTTMQDDLITLRTELDDRLSLLETVPRGPDGVAMPSTAAFTAEIDALRTQLTEMTGIARTELDAARAEAATIEQNAVTAARSAAARAALARLQGGVESGAALGGVLDDLTDALGAPLPDALLDVRDGVPTLAALQEAFPAAARTALTTARAAGVAGEPDTGIGAFLRNQFQVRSVNPRDGDTVDAILSRAQAALRQGQLVETLLEINTLPDEARAQMAEWSDLAQARADAVTAIDSLATSLRDN